MIVPGTFRDEIVKSNGSISKGLVKNIITTGGVTNERGDRIRGSETVLIDNGVPESIIFNETKSTNTKENGYIQKRSLINMVLSMTR